MYTKIKYVRKCYDYHFGSYGKKIVILIKPNGTIDVQISFKGTHKSTKTAEFNTDEYAILCDRLNVCIDNACKVSSYKDDGEDWLYLYNKIGFHKYPRGLGTEQLFDNVGSIVRSFVEDYIAEWWLEEDV